MSERRRLLINRAMCNACREVVESKHRHDFKYCGCGQMHVDGGLAYTKRGYKAEGFTELSEYEPEVSP